MNEIRFQHNVPDVCTMFVLTSDLGNNGLPLQYIGDPPYGVEVPFLGIDFDQFTIKVGDGTTVDASLPSVGLSVPEGDTINVPITVTNNPAIRPRIPRSISHSAPPAQRRRAPCHRMTTRTRSPSRFPKDHDLGRHSDPDDREPDR